MLIGLRGFVRLHPAPLCAFCIHITVKTPSECSDNHLRNRAYKSGVHAGIFFPFLGPDLVLLVQNIHTLQTFKNKDKKKQQKAKEGMEERRRVHSDLVPEATSDGRRSESFRPL